MARDTPSDRELDVLKVLWELGECPVRRVHEAMSPNGEFAFTTIQTLLRIMARKGFVTQRSEARTLFYSPNYGPEQASSRFLHKVFDGAVDKLVVNMLRAENLSDGELRQLEQLIANARKKRRRKGS